MVANLNIKNIHLDSVVDPIDYMKLINKDVKSGQWMLFD